MKKILLLVTFLPFISSGQNLSLGVDGVFPSGTLAASASSGIGGSIRYEHFLSAQLSLTGTGGYLSFAEKTITNSQANLTITTKTSMIPVQAGAKFYLFNRSNRRPQGLYLSGEMGMNYIFGKATVNGFSPDLSDDVKFCYAPGVGFLMGK